MSSATENEASPGESNRVENYESLFADDERSEVGSEEASDISRPGTPATFPAADLDLRKEANLDVSRRSTALKKEKLDPTKTYNAVKETVRTMESNGIDLPIFLEGVSWGSPECTRDPEIRFQRTTLLQSRELPDILKKWHTPPRSSTGMRRPVGGKAAMETFAVETTAQIITRELKVLGPLLRLPAGKDVKAEELTGTQLPAILDLMRSNAPVLWRLVNEALTADTTNKKDHDKLILTIISILCYGRNHHSNLLPKILSVYLKRGSLEVNSRNGWVRDKTAKKQEVIRNCIKLCDPDSDFRRRRLS